MFSRFDLPALLVADEADVRVIIDRLWRSQEDEAGFRRAGLLRLVDEFAADAVALVREPDGEVGEIGGVCEIGDAARDTDKDVAVPRSDD